jgi:hypothetical protein
MKKITKKMLLPVITILGLASCGGQTVKPEVAKQRAQKITEVQESKEFELPKKFYIDEDISMEMNKKSGSVSDTESSSLTSLISVDLENFQFYMSSKMVGFEEDAEVKVWMYLEGNTFYTVSELDDEKTYTKITIEINNFNFAEALGKSLNEVYNILSGKAYLNLDQYEEAKTQVAGQEIDFGTPSVTYTSTGDGNLGITQKASINTSVELQGSKVSTKGNSLIKVQFDNYIISSLESEVKASIKAGDGGVTITASSKMNVHLNDAKFSKPNLADFTEETAA